MLGGYTAGCAGRVLDPVNTILDGNQTGTVLVLSAPEVAAEFLVEGLTLRKGGYSGLRAVIGPGGEAMVANNVISGNTNPYYYYSYGGGVYLSATTATLTNNDISGNTASDKYDTSGGGAYISAITATLANNDISGNTTTFGGGGGLYLIATATLTNNTISGNTAHAGGGLHIAYQNSEPQRLVDLFNNLFWLNHATLVGADFYIVNPSLTPQIISLLRSSAYSRKNRSVALHS